MFNDRSTRNTGCVCLVIQVLKGKCISYVALTRDERKILGKVTHPVYNVVAGTAEGSFYSFRGNTDPV
jgi:hypothetical protein